MKLNVFFSVVSFFVCTIEVLYADVMDRMDLPKCEDPNLLYLLEGCLVQVSRGAYATAPFWGAVIKACTNDSTIAETNRTLNLDTLVQNVPRLELWGVEWPTIHGPSQVERVDMHDVTPQGVWGNCSLLTLMFIRGYTNTLTVLPDWLSNCTELHNLILARMTVAEIREVVDSAPRVKTLELYSIKDERLSHIVRYPLFSTERGRHQSITTFTLIGIDRKEDSLMDSNQNLTLEAADGWTEVSAALVRQLSMLPNLEKATINDDKFDFCPSGSFPSVILRSIRTLTLWSDSTSQLCFKSFRIMPQLRKLSLWFSRVDVDFKFSELFSVSAPQIEVDFENARIAKLEFVRDDYLALSDGEAPSKGNVTFSARAKARINCDCDSTFWFARALKQKLVTAPEIICHGGGNPVDLPCERLSCERVKCDSPCVCCREENDGLLADCRGVELGALSEKLLRLEHLTALLAPNNSISTLPDHLPDTLLWLDLTENNIWKNGGSKVDVLFTQPRRRIRLKGNNVICSCENQLLIITLQEKRDQIDDYGSLMCVADQKKLGEVNATNLCETHDRNTELLKHRQVWLAIAPVTLIIAAACLALGIVLRYKRREIQMFLFSRGWCLCCVQEEEIDADRRFDVFLSFCHADTELVLNQILPILDRQYTVCIHLRNWYPGGVIPAQITQSVEQSKRTVVVLSREFVKSVWGRLEFETAHVSALMEGRVRVIMVILDDVLEWKDLPEDMRAYVRINTYVRWGDPWFWKKMRYALPHRPTLKGPSEPYIVEMHDTGNIPVQIEEVNSRNDIDLDEDIRQVTSPQSM